MSSRHAAPWTERHFLPVLGSLTRARPGWHQYRALTGESAVADRSGTKGGAVWPDRARPQDALGTFSRAQALRLNGGDVPDEPAFSDYLLAAIREMEERVDAEFGVGAFHDLGGSWSAVFLRRPVTRTRISRSSPADSLDAGSQTHAITRGSALERRKLSEASQTRRSASRAPGWAWRWALSASARSSGSGTTGGSRKNGAMSGALMSKETHCAAKNPRSCIDGRCARSGKVDQERERTSGRGHARQSVARVKLTWYAAAAIRAARATLWMSRGPSSSSELSEDIMLPLEGVFVDAGGIPDPSPSPLDALVAAEGGLSGSGTVGGTSRHRQPRPGGDHPAPSRL